MPFSGLKLHPSLLRAIKELGFTRPTPIQADAIPPALEGRDLLACAMTGSGKTAAFLLPIVHKLIDKPRGTTRALVLTPTRELAAQILEDLNDLAVHTPVTGASIFGGVAMGPQEHAWHGGGGGGVHLERSEGSCQWMARANPGKIPRYARDDERNAVHDDTTTPYTVADRMQRTPQSLSCQAIPTLPGAASVGTALAQAALGLLLPAALAAQEIAPAEYAARRDSLAARLDSGVVVAFGAPTPTGIVQPGQLPAFRYLTGFLEPNAVLVLVLRGGRASGTLYTLARDPRRALYDGFMPDSAAIARATGLGARSFAALGPALDSLARTGLPFYTLRDFSGADFAQTDSLTRGAAFLRTFAAAHPGLEPRDAHPVVDSLRARKSPAELALLRRAIDITVAAHREALRAVRPGVWEYEIDALFASAFRRTGGDGPAFGSIIGSGPNSTQYHYETNNRRMQAGDVVVIDVGAGYRGYAADVTRTLPVSGRFTADQRTIYQLVRDAQAAAERVAGPGAAYAAWRDSARAVHRARRDPPRPHRRRGRDVRSPVGRPVRQSTDPLHPGVPLHGARARPRHRTGGPRSALSRIRPGRIPAGRRLHDRARHLRQHPAARHPARHAEEPVDDRPRAHGGRALQGHRRPDRGRLRDHRYRRRVAEPRAARDRGDRSRDGPPWPITSPGGPGGRSCSRSCCSRWPWWSAGACHTHRAASSG